MYPWFTQGAWYAGGLQYVLVLFKGYSLCFGPNDIVQLGLYRCLDDKEDNCALNSLLLLLLYYSFSLECFLVLSSLAMNALYLMVFINVCDWLQMYTSFSS